jgi:hypothetical protein
MRQTSRMAWAGVGMGAWGMLGLLACTRHAAGGLWEGLGLLGATLLVIAGGLLCGAAIARGPSWLSSPPDDEAASRAGCYLGSRQREKLVAALYPTLAERWRNALDCIWRSSPGETTVSRLERLEKFLSADPAWSSGDALGVLADCWARFEAEVLAEADRSPRRKPVRFAGWVLAVLMLLCGQAAAEPSARLYAAIRAVESAGSGGGDAVGDNGRSLGAYQISQAYWADACQFGGVRWDYASGVRDEARCRQVMAWYWQRYGARTDEQRARIHNGGPRGHLRKSTLGYWARVRKALR